MICMALWRKHVHGQLAGSLTPKTAIESVEELLEGTVLPSGLAQS